MPAADVPVYAIYCRLSRKASDSYNDDDDDFDDDTETVERQEALCRKYAAEEGLTVSEAHLYVDNHRSAWKRNGSRPRWDAMISAGRRGEFGGVLAYKLDRFSRNVRDAEDLVDLAEKRRVLVDGPKHGRIDLSTAHGRRTFREAAVQAAGESDNTSERVTDALTARTSRGLLLGGGRLYGFEVLSQVRTRRKDVTPRQRPAEVAVIREAAARLLAGEHLADIAADFNARGLLTVRGGQWTGGNLGRMLGAPRYGGYAVRRGEVVGRAAGEPVLDPDTYAQVQAILAGRRRGRRATGLWPLTGVLRCGNPGCPEPGRTMAGHTSSRKRADGTAPRAYTCALGNGGCGMTILADPVEAMVRARVMKDTKDEDLLAELSEQAQAVNDAKGAASAEVARLDQRLTDLEAKLAAETIRPHAYEAAKAVLDRRIREAEAARDALGASRRTGGLSAVDEAKWDAMTAAEKRGLITELRLEVTVFPLRPDGPRNRFDPERVQIRP